MEFNATFLVSAISFIIFVFIMNFIFYSPLEKIITKREKLVDDTLNEANMNNEKAQCLLNEHDDKLANANIESKKLINDIVTDSELKARENTLQAKNEATKQINEQKEKLQLEKAQAQTELDNQVKMLADIIVEKVVS